MGVEKFDYTTAYQEHGNGIYLEKGETFEEVVVQDAKVLEAGVNGNHPEGGTTNRKRYQY